MRIRIPLNRALDALEAVQDAADRMKLDRDELLLALREAREAWAGKDWDSGRSMRCRGRVDAILAKHEPPPSKCFCGPDYACPVCWDEKLKQPSQPTNSKETER